MVAASLIPAMFYAANADPLYPELIGAAWMAG
jgi:hypothetical protein